MIKAGRSCDVPKSSWLANKQRAAWNAGKVTEQLGPTATGSGNVAGVTSSVVILFRRCRCRSGGGQVNPHGRLARRLVRLRLLIIVLHKNPIMPDIIHQLSASEPMEIFCLPGKQSAFHKQSCRGCITDRRLTTEANLNNRSKILQVFHEQHPGTIGRSPGPAPGLGRRDP